MIQRPGLWRQSTPVLLTTCLEDASLSSCTSPLPAVPAILSEKEIFAEGLEVAYPAEGGGAVVFCSLGQAVAMPAVRLEEANSAQLAGWSGGHTGCIPELHYAVLAAGEQQPSL